MAWMRFRKKEMPGGLWSKCPQCDTMLYQKDLDANAKVCTKCSHHLRLNVAERIRLTLDENSFEEFDANMTTIDALDFIDKAPYPEKLAATRKKTERKEAMVYGTGRLRGRPVVFGALEFGFLGGSMGVVVGEKVARAAELAHDRKFPLILFSASGGARMHEGALSLMQMAKSGAALGRLAEAGGLYVSVLAHPTTGGVTASWATMADVVLAEPKALIGFAGPRVIQNTIRQELPEGFQTAEFLLDRGQLDRIVPRTQLVDTLEQIFNYCLGPLEESTADEPSAGADEEAAVRVGESPNGRPVGPAETGAKASPKGKPSSGQKASDSEPAGGPENPLRRPATT
jgi:acetyl-CoA carboxylase carboxyl transferase subunit beta